MHQGGMETTLPAARGSKVRQGGELGDYHDPELGNVPGMLEEYLARAGSFSRDAYRAYKPAQVQSPNFKVQPLVSHAAEARYKTKQCRKPASRPAASRGCVSLLAAFILLEILAARQN